MGQSFFALAGALALAATFATSLAADEPAPNPADATTAAPNPQPATPADARQRIERVLNAPLREPLDFVEAPLRDVVEILAESYDIPIQFDMPALDAVAASPDAEVSARIANVTLRSALNLMLKSAGAEPLTYVVADEVLLITTQEEAETRREVVVYRVDDLIAPLTPWDDDADYDRLIDVIVATVENESWMENGTGEGEIQPFPPGMIVVTQTARVHEQIESLLARLRKTKHAIDRDQTESADAARDAPVTRGFAIGADVGLTAVENREAIVAVIKGSVDWQPADGESAAEDAFITVLPGRIIVRHTPAVVRQAERVIDELTGARGLPPGMGPFGGGGATDGRANRGQPDLAAPPRAGEDNGRSPRSQSRGGF